MYIALLYFYFVFPVVGIFLSGCRFKKMGITLSRAIKILTLYKFENIINITFT